MLITRRGAKPAKKSTTADCHPVLSFAFISQTTASTTAKFIWHGHFVTTQPPSRSHIVSILADHCQTYPVELFLQGRSSPLIFPICSHYGKCNAVGTALRVDGSNLELPSALDEPGRIADYK
jgi:hypothetical protein